MKWESDSLIKENVNYIREKIKEFDTFLPPNDFFRHFIRFFSNLFFSSSDYKLPTKLQNYVNIIKEFVTYK